MRAEGGTERANEVNIAEEVVCKVFYKCSAETSIWYG